MSGCTGVARTVAELRQVAGCSSAWGLLAVRWSEAPWLLAAPRPVWSVHHAMRSWPRALCSSCLANACSCYCCVCCCCCCCWRGGGFLEMLGGTADPPAVAVGVLRVGILDWQQFGHLSEYDTRVSACACLPVIAIRPTCLPHTAPHSPARPPVCPPARLPAQLPACLHAAARSSWPRQWLAQRTSPSLAAITADQPGRGPSPDCSGGRPAGSCTCSATSGTSAARRPPASPPCWRCVRWPPWWSPCPSTRCWTTTSPSRVPLPSPPWPSWPPPEAPRSFAHLPAARGLPPPCRAYPSPHSGGGQNEHWLGSTGPCEQCTLEPAACSPRARQSFLVPWARPPLLHRQPAQSTLHHPRFSRAGRRGAGSVHQPLRSAMACRSARGSTGWCAGAGSS
jgi:hypothetical protein